MATGEVVDGGPSAVEPADASGPAVGLADADCPRDAIRDALRRANGTADAEVEILGCSRARLAEPSWVAIASRRNPGPGSAGVVQVVAVDADSGQLVAAGGLPAVSADEAATALFGVADVDGNGQDEVLVREHGDPDEGFVAFYLEFFYQEGDRFKDSGLPFLIGLDDRAERGENDWTVCRATVEVQPPSASGCQALLVEGEVEQGPEADPVTAAGCIRGTRWVVIGDWDPQTLCDDPDSIAAIGSRLTWSADAITAEGNSSCTAVVEAAIAVLVRRELFLACDAPVDFVGCHAARLPRPGWFAMVQTGEADGECACTSRLVAIDTATGAILAVLPFEHQGRGACSCDYPEYESLARVTDLDGDGTDEAQVEEGSDLHATIMSQRVIYRFGDGGFSEFDRRVLECSDYEGDEPQDCTADAAAHGLVDDETGAAAQLPVRAGSVAGLNGPVGASGQGACPGDAELRPLLDRAVPPSPGESWTVLQCAVARLPDSAWVVLAQETGAAAGSRSGAAVRLVAMDAATGRLVADGSVQAPGSARDRGTIELAGTADLDGDGVEEIFERAAGPRSGAGSVRLDIRRLDNGAWRLIGFVVLGYDDGPIQAEEGAVTTCRTDVEVQAADNEGRRRFVVDGTVTRGGAATGDVPTGCWSGHHEFVLRRGAIHEIQP